MSNQQNSRVHLSTGALRLRFRVVLAIFMVGLVLSGITSFPLQRELKILASLLGIPSGASAPGGSGLGTWIVTIRNGLEATYLAYPWVAYGTDWLAFAHIVIAIFFIGPLVNPVRNVWVLWAGLIACVLVIPLALICGPIRQIPFGWRLIDCSFGIGGAIPLIYCIRMAGRLVLEERTHVP